MSSPREKGITKVRGKSKRGIMGYELNKNMHGAGFGGRIPSYRW